MAWQEKTDRDITFSLDIRELLLAQGLLRREINNYPPDEISALDYYVVANVLGPRKANKLATTLEKRGLALQRQPNIALRDNWHPLRAHLFWLMVRPFYNRQKKDLAAFLGLKPNSISMAINKGTILVEWINLVAESRRLNRETLMMLWEPPEQEKSEGRANLPMVPHPFSFPEDKPIYLGELCHFAAQLGLSATDYMESKQFLHELSLYIGVPPQAVVNYLQCQFFFGTPYEDIFFGKTITMVKNFYRYSMGQPYGNFEDEFGKLAEQGYRRYYGGQTYSMRSKGGGKGQGYGR